MKVYNVPQEALAAIGKELNINVIIDRVVHYSSNSRKNPPGGINYIVFKLRPIGDFYRKINHSFGKERRTTVCWHGHADFMKRLFELYPKAKITSNPLDMPSIVYNGKEDFYNKYQSTYNQKQPLNSIGTMWTTCNCND
jgi:hypothetical protein